MIKRITLTVPLSLHRDLKSLAAYQDLTLSQLFLRALRDYMERYRNELRSITPKH